MIESPPKRRVYHGKEKDRRQFNHHRPQQEGAPRLFHRRALRGRPAAAGLGGEVAPRRTGEHRERLRPHEERRGLAPRLAVHPLDAACTHTICDPDRTRKLLLNQREIDKLTGFANRKGFTVIPLALYWKGSWVKCEIGICRGKKDYDKREDIKTRDWAREHQRIMKRGGR